MMIDASERHSAKLFLNDFEPKARKKGRLAYRRNRLGEVLLDLNGAHHPVLVESGVAADQPKVELRVENANWSASCACGAAKCEHVYAAMLLLLRSGEEYDDEAKVQETEEAPKTLRELAKDGLGRKLRDHESDFLNQVQLLYRKAHETHSVGKYELHSVLNFNWYEAPANVPLSSKPPKDELSFWHDLMAYALLFGGKIPDFAKPFTDSDRIAEIQRSARRRQSIHDWQSTISTLEISNPGNSPEMLDFRVAVVSRKMHVEYCDCASQAFRAPKSREWEHIVGKVTDGQAMVTDDAWPIFHAFSEKLHSYGGTEFSLEDRGMRRFLSSLLRVPSLAQRVVTPAGVPFAKANAPLRWEIKEDSGEDYILQLSNEQGECPTVFQAVLPGQPFLYLTDSAIFEGPFKPHAFSPGPHCIPGPALETEDGLRLIASLGLPLPERLAKRTKTVPMSVSMQCSIGTLSKYEETEYCFIKVAAKAAEGGRVEEFAGVGWVEKENKGKRAGNNRPLYIYDRATMGLLPNLMVTLGASWSDYVHRQCWRLRVTRNFPEKFLAWIKTIPPQIGLLLEGELATLVRDPVLARLELDCQEVGVDWFDLKTTIRVEDTTLTPEELKLLLNARGKAVRLPGKGWRRLEYQLTEEEDHCLAKLGLNANDFSSEPQRLHALQLAERAAEKMIAAEQFRRIQARAGEIKARVSPPVPAGISATLRPYQVEGFHFLAYLSENSFGGVLADDMGLGKTLQTLAWLAWVREKNSENKPSLVVCPKSVMDNWATEATKFLPGLRVKLWRGLEEESLSDAAHQTDLLVLNYPQLRNLAEIAAKVNWDAIILDEAQAIKNPDSQTAQAVRALHSSHRLALSGTPIENRLLDLWSIMSFAMPGVLGNRADFKRRFDQANDKLARRRLSSRLRPFLLRRTKNQVASELPDRIEEDLVCELEGTQKTLYRAEFKRAQQMLLRVQTQEALNEFRFHFLTSLLRLRQICCHPALTDETLRKEESAKLNALIELLEPLMEEGHKVLVFSQFVTMLQILQEEVKSRQWDSFYLAGDTENRGDLVQKFQDHKGSAVFLISLKAGGFGLNLTAASYVVLYDPWWNPAVENQAIDRTHRIGQTQKVIAYRLITKGSIEEKIRALQKQKSALVEDVLGDEAFSSSLTIDDLQYLFAEEPRD